MNNTQVGKLISKNSRYTVAFGESLYLRVYPSGCKSWVLRYSFMNRVRDITLGNFPQLSVAQARQAAHLKRAELKIKPSEGLTFKDAYALWKRKKRGTIVSYKVESKRIETYILPSLKNIELEKITAPIVLQILSPLRDKFPTLRRMLMRINEILDLAICAGYLTYNPCRKLSRMFTNYTVTNRAYIPACRIGEMFRVLNGEKMWMHLLVLFAMYSGLRPVECVSVKWCWIDKGVLTLPAEIMKKRREHRVPLCPKMLVLLDLVKRIRPRISSFVWAFTPAMHVHRQHISKWLNYSAVHGQISHHGFRATFRTWMRDEGAPHEVAEDAIAHITGTMTERAYIRGDYLEQRIPIMEKWFDYIFDKYSEVIMDDPAGSTIVSIMRAYIKAKEAQRIAALKKQMEDQNRNKSGGNSE